MHRIHKGGNNVGCGFIVASEWNSGEERLWCGRLISVFKKGQVDVGMILLFVMLGLVDDVAYM
jgi:hypothetical protein